MVNKENRLFGIKFWAIHNDKFKPSYQVFRYRGHVDGLHYFEGIRGNRASFGLSLDQIGNVDIKPFCLNSEHLALPGSNVEPFIRKAK